MEETLKKELCARLPYGVKAEISGKIGILYLSIIPVGREDNPLFGIKCDSTKNFYEHKSPKPILFPISCLAKEITVNNYNNGKPFNPIDEINRLASLNKEISQRIEWDDSEDNFLLKIDYFMGGWEINFITDLLNMWHINYRLPDNQFIKATNEYA